MDVWVEGWTDGWVGGGRDGWIHGWLEGGRTDARGGGQIEEEEGNGETQALGQREEGRRINCEMPETFPGHVTRCLAPPSASSRLRVPPPPRTLPSEPSGESCVIKWLFDLFHIVQFNLLHLSTDILALFEKYFFISEVF